MCSCCNLSLCSAVIILFINLNCLESNLFYVMAIFLQKSFFLRIKICNAHASSDVTIVDLVFKLQSNRVNLVSFRRFLIADYINY